MITLEIVKGLQVLGIEKDQKLKENFGEKTKILSMKLHEDLGNIKYIFTDKTGTLTKNEMEFKSCSIFTKLFDENEEIANNDPDNELNERNFTLNAEKKSIYASNFDPNILKDALQSDEPLKINDLENTPFLSLRETVIEFFLNIALNHNVLTEIDHDTYEKYYSGSSPDVVVLVQSAKEIGIEFLERSGDISRINILGKEFTFQVLHRFEYTSDRKRSSIIVKDEFDNIKLYMKGADKVILDKIDNYSKEFIYFNTKEHLEKFCKSGLRTLVYSMKMLTKSSLDSWEDEYNKIQDIVLNDKSKKPELEKKIEEIEDKMLLIGASALEDKLQDDVKGVLQDFLEADINVWMLTGDQLDTAESIGYSCKLFNDDTEIYKVRDGFKNNIVSEILKNILGEMEKTEDDILKYKIEKRRKSRNSNDNDKNKLIVNAQAMLKHEMENKKKKNEKLKKQVFNENTNYNKKESMKINPRFSKLKSSNNIKENLEDPEKLYGDLYKKDIEFQKLNGNESRNLKNMPYSNRFEHYRANFNQIRENFENGNQVLFNSQQINNLKKIKTNNDSSNNTNNSLAKIKGYGPNFLRKSSQIPIDINQLNAENIKFIGGNLDKKSNKITLNFVKNSNNSIQNSNQPMTPGYSKSGRPISSSVYSYKKTPVNTFNNPKISSQFGFPHNNERSELEESQNYEPNDTSIIRYMVDVDFFENNKNNQNYTFVKNLLGNNIHASKMNKDGVIEIKPFPTERKISNYININEQNENINNEEENKLEIYENKNNFINNLYDESDNLNLDKILEDYKMKVMTIDATKSTNPFNFVKHQKKNILSTNFGIIIEGNAISQCLDPEIYPIFWDIIVKSRAIICCRCSPNFKSDVVDFVKKMSGEITLAIGDGGNDVNMIKAANIGVGIFGKEGHQAAFNSDYAISQFKYIERLLFYHGRYSVLRNSYFINFFFYKNLIFTFPQFWFSLFSGFSGALLWDDWYYLGYNSYISSLPACCKMLYDEDIDVTFQNYKDKQLLEL